MNRTEPIDLVLSCGYLAFCRQTGFLRAIERSGLTIGAVVGTSSGALAGALWLGGMSAEEILKVLSTGTPLERLRLNYAAPWRGVFSLDGMIAELEELLPPRFSDLPMPFAVGVGTPGGGHRLITEGPLPRAVAASCAIPYLFGAVEVDGVRYVDGGAVDRLALDAWRAWRPERDAIVHIVNSRRWSEPDPTDQPFVRTPRAAQAYLWNLGDIQGRFDATVSSVSKRLITMEL